MIEKDLIIKIIAWIVILIVVMYGLSVTKSPWCIWGLLIPKLFVV